MNLDEGKPVFNPGNIWEEANRKLHGPKENSFFLSRREQVALHMLCAGNRKLDLTDFSLTNLTAIFQNADYFLKVSKETER
jgi:hypothetical protein